MIETTMDRYGALNLIKLTNKADNKSEEIGVESRGDLEKKTTVLQEKQIKNVIVYAEVGRSSYLTGFKIVYEDGDE